MGNPPTNSKVSTLTPNTQLKKAFSFVIGNQIQWQTDSGEKITWEVKRDYWLNTYLECKKTASKAFYKLDEGTLHFVHFNGDRKSLLYQFYLAAYKISFGYSNKLQLKDSFPVHMVFHPNRIFIQDIIAPFYRYLKGEYLLTYPDKARGLGLQVIELKSKVVKKAFGKEREASIFQFQVDGSGLQSFQIQNKHFKTQAKCIVS